MVYKNKKLKIIKKYSNKNFKETGCCFRTCGGAPVVQQFSSNKEYKNTITFKKINHFS